MDKINENFIKYAIAMKAAQIVLAKSGYARQNFNGEVTAKVLDANDAANAKIAYALMEYADSLDLEGVKI